MLEQCVQKSVSDAVMGVGERIAVSMWTFGFYSHL